MVLLVLLLWKSGQINFSSFKLGNKQANAPAFKIEYLSAEEKAKLNISPEVKAQVLQRDSGNSVTVYKIIKNNSDLVTDLSQVEAQRPPRPEKTGQ